ncbi:MULTISPECIES: hypothetical protein [unclassified Actinobaculum]|uniref:hypothetical protein n=1 Tax=unclassified Actinobaculum TaxID=2609299 RepID=UPI000D529B90|nr:MULTISPECIES: hypothetical protein [unclassified Actinobaculum]AWE42755.1 hypothetical protein DDD63_08375 [Actinobaculum sp. 313]RTE49570.1 hypothetical protein EKN07_05850 [Actinobaculum sp. 352]
MVTLTKKRLVAILASLAVIIGAAVYVVFWRPLPQGTPELSPEIEVLRNQAMSLPERGPLDFGDYSIVVTSVSTTNVGVSFARDGNHATHTTIAVGSSEEVLGCTITVLESHPTRSDNGSALVAIQCPDEASATHSPIPDTGP